MTTRNNPTEELTAEINQLINDMYEIIDDMDVELEEINQYIKRES